MMALPGSAASADIDDKMTTDSAVPEAFSNKLAPPQIADGADCGGALSLLKGLNAGESINSPFRSDAHLAPSELS